MQLSKLKEEQKHPDATRLLEMNRRFIPREIVEWTEYQVANNISPFTTSFTYDSKKCERDMGYIIDAFLYDLKHGGNVNPREAAPEYVTTQVSFIHLDRKQKLLQVLITE